MYCCHNVLLLFLAMPFVGMQCVIVEFPDHTDLLFNALVLGSFYLDQAFKYDGHISLEKRA